jgi:hypothetical protein
MNTRTLFLSAILLSGILIACNNGGSSENNLSASASIGQHAGRSNSMFINANYSDWSDKISSARINFGDFTVAISGIDMWSDSNAPINTSGDVVNVDIAPGNTLEEQVISLSSGVLENVQIEQRFETSMLVYGNEKQCELLNWKHFSSDWSVLNKTPKGDYQCKSYNLKERTQFPSFSLEEIKEEIKNNCNETCYEDIKNASAIDENNSAVVISHYFIKISGTNKSTGKVVEKTIKVYNPIGC